MSRLFACAAFLLSAAALSRIFGQQSPVPLRDPVPSGRRGSAEPAAPPAKHVHVDRAHLTLDVPAGWNVTRRDGEISTFALDARTSQPSTRMDLAAGLAWNPYPYSTFAGALFYVSQTPRSTALDCRDQASSPLKRPVTTSTLDGIAFQHGYAEHGSMCIESRDEVYTAQRPAACLRFDLVINTFCSQGSGAREMTASELAGVEHRLESILESVHFDQPAGAATAVAAHAR